MIEWIYYVVGLIFLVLFILSIMTKPILFREKWQAGLGYGIYAVLYLGLFFLMFFGEYNVTANNVNTTDVKTSNVSVKGPVVAIEPRSVKKSTFQDIPVQEVKEIPVQKIDVTPVQNASSNTTTTTSSGNQYVDASGKGTIIGDTDSKIYHLPGDPYYEKEMQKTSNNVYFKTAAEAESAGYRAIKQ
ncbi:hypothetical protein ACFHWD_14515 [Clostridium sp. MT-14]|uniref:sunset domain-containing protein n=1 Tax=unclassified Clostridium TaxID=2614128 RepID=UPI00123B0E3C|nr:hypothetical protein [Clostridium sp. HV4-5-A1G]KAA8676190.1 hypothetical protein F3O63_03705 [Clostridium sp. HV4-5-A1G]